MNKYFNNILIIDGSYMIHRSLKTPDLWELKNRKGERTGGVFGFLKSLVFSIRSTNYFPIICWDSGQSPRRLEIYPNYKHHLDKAISRRADKYALMLLMKEIENLPDDVTIEERSLIEESVKRLNEIKLKHGSYKDPDDYIDQYIRQRDIIMSICSSLGIPSIIYPHWEGDDLITLVSRISSKSVILTDDKDMIQLISPTIDIYRVMNKQYLKYGEYLSNNKVISTREFVISKAISGDPSDNIPSVTDNEVERKYRVGGVTASRIARVIVEENEDTKKYIDRLSSINDRDKNKILGFIRNHSIYERNMKLVDLSLVENDLQVINSIISEVRSKAGKIKFFDVTSKLGLLEINSIDVSSLVSMITKLYTDNFKG